MRILKPLIGIIVLIAVFSFLFPSATNSMFAVFNPMPPGPAHPVCLNGACDYDTIQDAMDAASSGDLIEVGNPQTFTESIDFTDNNITLDCNNSTISGGSEEPLSTGISIIGYDNNIIKNCNFINFYASEVFIANGTNNFIDNSIFNVYDTSDARGVTIIAEEDVSYNKINNSQFLFSGESECYGVYVEEEEYTEILNSNFIGNGESEYGIYLEGTDDTIIENNYFKNLATGVYEGGTEDTEVIDNEFLDMFEYAIYGEEVFDNIYSGNIIRITEEPEEPLPEGEPQPTTDHWIEENAGIEIYYGIDSIIENNEISGMMYGIFLEDVFYATIQDNDIEGSYIGIESISEEFDIPMPFTEGDITFEPANGEPEYPTGNIFHNNEVSDSIYGMLIFVSEDTTFSENNIHNNCNGIGAMFLENAAFEENRIAQNRYYEFCEGFFMGGPGSESASDIVADPQQEGLIVILPGLGLGIEASRGITLDGDYMGYNELVDFMTFEVNPEMSIEGGIDFEPSTDPERVACVEINNCGDCIFEGCMWYEEIIEGPVSETIYYCEDIGPCSESGYPCVEQWPACYDSTTGCEENACESIEEEPFGLRAFDILVENEREVGIPVPMNWFYQSEVIIWNSEFNERGDEIETSFENSEVKFYGTTFDLDKTFGFASDFYVAPYVRAFVHKTSEASIEDALVTFTTTEGEPEEKIQEGGGVPDESEEPEFPEEQTIVLETGSDGYTAWTLVPALVRLYDESGSAMPSGEMMEELTLYLEIPFETEITAEKSDETNSKTLIPENYETVDIELSLSRKTVAGGGGTKSFSPPPAVDAGNIGGDTVGQGTYGTGTRVSFQIRGSSHTMTVNSVGNNFVSVTIESDPQTVVVYVGQPQEVDLDGDGVNDMLITLLGVENGEANIEYREIVPEVKEPITPVTTGEPTLEPIAEEPEAPAEEPLQIDYAVTLFLVVLLLVAFFVFLKKKKKKSKVEKPEIEEPEETPVKKKK